MPYVIESENLIKKYADVPALDALSLNISQGEIYGLLGPNGAGKTTFIKLLLGLLRPNKGLARIFNIVVPNDSISHKIGYMPQEIALYLDMTVHENLMLFGELYGMKKNEILKREEELLKVIDLQKWKTKVIAKLSGGMKHRVSLAASLIHDPDLIVLDEPTVGVDPELRASFWNYFHLLRDRGKTILMTTHYMDEANNCTKIGLISQGKLIAEGTPDEILSTANSQSLDEAFIILAGGKNNEP